jgi:hypothetical protein
MILTELWTVSAVGYEKRDTGVTITACLEAGLVIRGSELALREM